MKVLTMNKHFLNGMAVKGDKLIDFKDFLFSTIYTLESLRETKLMSGLLVEIQIEFFHSLKHFLLLLVIVT